jgi:hypothetical protein
MAADLADRIPTRATIRPSLSAAREISHNEEAALIKVSIGPLPLYSRPEICTADT